MVEFTARSHPDSGFAIAVAGLPERPTLRYDSVGCTTRRSSSGLFGQPELCIGGGGGVGDGTQAVRGIYGRIMDAADGSRGF